MALFGPSDSVVNALAAAVNKASDAVLANTKGDAARIPVLQAIQHENHQDQEALRKLIRDSVNATANNIGHVLDFVAGVRRELLEALQAHTAAVQQHAAVLQEHAVSLAENTSALLAVAQELHDAQQPPARPRIDFNIGPITEQ